MSPRKYTQHFYEVCETHKSASGKAEIVHFAVHRVREVHGVDNGIYREGVGLKRNRVLRVGRGSLAACALDGFAVGFLGDDIGAAGIVHMDHMHFIRLTENFGSHLDADGLCRLRFGAVCLPEGNVDCRRTASASGGFDGLVENVLARDLLHRHGGTLFKGALIGLDMDSDGAMICRGFLVEGYGGHRNFFLFLRPGCYGFPDDLREHNRLRKASVKRRALQRAVFIDGQTCPVRVCEVSQMIFDRVGDGIAGNGIDPPGGLIACRRNRGTVCSVLLFLTCFRGIACIIEAVLKLGLRPDIIIRCSAAISRLKRKRPGMESCDTVSGGIIGLRFYFGGYSGQNSVPVVRAKRAAGHRGIRRES